VPILFLYFDDGELCPAISMLADTSIQLRYSLRFLLAIINITVTDIAYEYVGIELPVLIY